MLIVLKTSTEELGNDNIANLEQLFTELIRASINGLHLVVIERKICEWAIDNLDLSGREKARLKHLKQQFTQNGSLQKFAPCYMDIFIGEYGLTEVSDNKYKIGHINLLRSEYLSETILLVENARNDGDFVLEILNCLRRRLPIKNFNLRPVNGGGGEIVHCLRREIIENRMVVCIADSDKYAPCATFSGTVKSLKREAKRQTFVGIVCETKCREAENHIPSVY